MNLYFRTRRSSKCKELCFRLTLTLTRWNGDVFEQHRLEHSPLQVIQTHSAVEFFIGWYRRCGNPHCGGERTGESIQNPCDDRELLRRENHRGLVLREFEDDSSRDGL